MGKSLKVEWVWQMNTSSCGPAALGCVLFPMDEILTISLLRRSSAAIFFYFFQQLSCTTPF
jgi:hypothetical protein